NAVLPDMGHLVPVKPGPRPDAEIAEYIALGKGEARPKPEARGIAMRTPARLVLRITPNQVDEMQKQRIDGQAKPPAVVQQEGQNPRPRPAVDAAKAVKGPRHRTHR